MTITFYSNISNGEGGREENGWNKLKHDSQENCDSRHLP